MEPCSILKILKPLVELMLPDNAPRAIQINHAQEKPIFCAVLSKCERALEATIRPPFWLRIRKVDAGETGGEDLIGSVRNRRFYFRLFVVGQRRLCRHPAQRLW